MGLTPVDEADNYNISHKINGLFGVRRFVCYRLNRRKTTAQAEEEVKPANISSAHRINMYQPFVFVPMNKNVLVVGVGRVGFRVADWLRSDRHTVTVIENEAARCDELSTSVNRVINGDGKDPSVLEKAHLEDIDVVAALTDNTETNLTVCKMVRNRAPDVRTILRIEQDGEQDYGYRSFVDHVVYPAAAGAEVTIEKIAEK